MSRVRTQTDVRLAPSDGHDNYIHIVGDLQHWLDRLGLKIPRSLCGVLLVADPDKPDPLAVNAPTCPKCAALDR